MTEKNNPWDIFENGADGSASHLKRSCGILMPVFSLPSPHGIGTFGAAAYEFADFLAASGQSYWQVLPLNPTGFGDSPYQCFSSAAGNPYFIDLDMLVDDGLLTADEVQKSDFGGELRRIDYGKLFSLRLPLLRLAAERNIRRNAAEVEQFSRCCSTQIYDYAVFTALKTHFGMKPWTEWNAGKAMPKQLVPAEFVESQADEIRLQLSIQQLFFKQWNRLKNYVNQLGIGIIGDVPIYVALDSADCWANSRHFMLGESFVPTDVAGVPPDYFSPTGQLWGNPLYNWEIHASENYAWWAERLQCAQKLYDVVRIDHFRGFESFWAVPFGETTAENGRWLPAPGMDFVNAVKKRLPGLSFIAEDLGFLTPEVHELVKNSGFPGMSILQFGFNPDANSDYLPHRVQKQGILYRYARQCTDYAMVRRGLGARTQICRTVSCAECRRGYQLGYDSRRHVFACRNLYRANAGCSRAFGGREGQHSGRCFRKLAVADAAARMQCRACGKAAGVYANVRKTARLRRDKLWTQYRCSA